MPPPALDIFAFRRAIFLSVMHSLQNFIFFASARSARAAKNEPATPNVSTSHAFMPDASNKLFSNQRRNAFAEDGPILLSSASCRKRS
jgi:hypothetical protein